MRPVAQRVSRYVGGVHNFGLLKRAALLLVEAVGYRLVFGGLTGHSHGKLRRKCDASGGRYNVLSARRGEVDYELYRNRNVVICGRTLGLNLQSNNVRTC